MIATVQTAATDGLAVPRRRLALLLLLAPALLWLFGLIVLPHIELAVLSLRARVAPRVFEWSLAQVLDLLRGAALLAHVRAHGDDVDRRDARYVRDRVPGRLVHREDRQGPRAVAAFRAVPDPVLGERDRAHAGMDDPAA